MGFNSGFKGLKYFAQLLMMIESAHSSPYSHRNSEGCSALTRNSHSQFPEKTCLRQPLALAEVRPRDRKWCKMINGTSCHNLHVAILCGICLSFHRAHDFCYDNFITTEKPLHEFSRVFAQDPSLSGCGVVFMGDYFLWLL